MERGNACWHADTRSGFCLPHFVCATRHSLSVCFDSFTTRGLKAFNIMLTLEQICSSARGMNSMGVCISLCVLVKTHL